MEVFFVPNIRQFPKRPKKFFGCTFFSGHPAAAFSCNFLHLGVGTRCEHSKNSSCVHSDVKKN